MRISVIYLNIMAPADSTAPPPEHYRPWAKRFVETFQKFRGSTPFKLEVVHCGAPADVEAVQIFEACYAWHFCYKGGGWDVGAHQYQARHADADFVICLATPVYFWREGFIERMVEARKKFGDGLYGATASYEWSPHIRTCCWAFDPETFAKYPHTIDSREKTFRAESGDLSITRWYESQGKPRIMVAADGFYEQPDWRKPPNIFRRGDQSNCLVRDRHTDLWDESSPERKQELADWADGKLNHP